MGAPGKISTSAPNSCTALIPYQEPESAELFVFKQILKFLVRPSASCQDSIDVDTTYEYERPSKESLKCLDKTIFEIFIRQIGNFMGAPGEVGAVTPSSGTAKKELLESSISEQFLVINYGFPRYSISDKYIN